mgnify:CR=1 FL=1
MPEAGAWYIATSGLPVTVTVPQPADAQTTEPGPVTAATRYWTWPGSSETAAGETVTPTSRTVTVAEAERVVSSVLVAVTVQGPEAGAT